MGSVNEEAHREDLLIIPVATTEVGHFGYRILNQVGISYVARGIYYLIVACTMSDP